MDTESDADIESLKSLISDEINNTNNDDCSQNSFDAELNLLATTLKENDVKNESNNETDETCDVQNNIKDEIGPNNHITDNLKELMTPSPLHESHEMSNVFKDEVLENEECDNTDNDCDFNVTDSGLQGSIIDESSNSFIVTESKDNEKYVESTVGDGRHCNIPLVVENEDCCETSSNTANNVTKIDEEVLGENSINLNMTDENNILFENDIRGKIYCSTPLVKELAIKKVTGENNTTLLGLSPIATSTSSRLMKRKLCSEILPSIKEEEEGDEEELIVPVKKPKCDDEHLSIAEDLKTHMKIIEPPAMAILKKWRPKCLSSSAAYYVIDECSDTQSSQTENEDDDFEIAMKNLSEELFRQSDADDLKTLDLYHNHVLAENEEDGLKFEEILQQMTNELGGMSEFISIDKIDGSMSSNDVEKNETTIIKMDCVENSSSTLVDSSQQNHDSTLVEKQSVENDKKTEDKVIAADDKPASNDDDDDDDDDDIIIIKENLKPVENLSKELSSNSDIEYITLTDEEDVLLKDEPEMNLENDASQRKKCREMVEFISKDPKENEDNFNPEWELLRKLNTDEERYKAVRKRWRSLVIPDPKRDLTFRQWRWRNNLPPSKHLQGNTKATQQQIRKYIGNQLCTALFDQNIEGVLRQKEEKRLTLNREFQSKIQRLGLIQDQEQRNWWHRRVSGQEFSLMYLRQVEELRRLQVEHQKRLENEERASFEKIEALKKASAEVLAFEKFYQGLDNDKKDNAAFLSDIEIQELMETEIMLEQYDRYYI